MSVCCEKNNSESAGPSEAQAEYYFRTDRKFVIPRSWIYQEVCSERITLQVKLPGCKKDDIRVKIWNQRQLLVRATCQFHHYELQYRIPRGGPSLCQPTFASKTETLTCQFRGFSLECAVCHAKFPCHPILAKEMFASVLNRPSLKFIQPRHSITYDGNMALFEAHLDGCENPSEINFKIANDKVMLLAGLCAQHSYLLSFRLESSAEYDWEAYFDRKSEIFTCTIPLLGHYECEKCIAKRYQRNAQGTSVEKVEKVMGAEMEKIAGPSMEKVAGPRMEKVAGPRMEKVAGARMEKVAVSEMEKASSSGCPSGSHRQETKQSLLEEMANCGKDNVKTSLDVVDVKDTKNSDKKIFLYSETEI